MFINKFQSDSEILSASRSNITPAKSLGCGEENIEERPSDINFLSNSISVKVPRASLLDGGVTKSKNYRNNSNFMSIDEK